MLFSLLALRLPLCWSQSLPGADGDVAIRNAAVETVLYSFAEDVNGAYPLSRVLMGSNGRLYGTTNLSGIAGGTVFELTRSRSGVWTITAVHDFDVNTEGAYPVAGLVFDTSGRLYGTTTLGGASNAGTVFEWFYESGAWQFKVIYTFAGAMMAKLPPAILSSMRPETCTERHPMGESLAKGRSSSWYLLKAVNGLRKSFIVFAVNATAQLQ